MVGIAYLVAGLVTQSKLFPAHLPYRSREEFYRLQTKLDMDFTRAEVLKVLGPPDAEVRDENEFNTFRLKYGVDKATRTATLGEIILRNGLLVDGYTRGRVTDFMSGEQYRQLIPESELRPILGTLGQQQPEWLDNDPLWLIRMANMLIRLGDEKAKYVLGEHERTHSWYEVPQYEQLLFLIFQPGSSPRFVPLSTDIPISVGGGFVFTGAPTSTRRFADSQLRKTSVRPPNDPFLFIKSVSTNLETKPEWNIDNVLPPLLKMVRGVIQPVDFRLVDYPIRNQFDKFHQEFLRHGPTWDEKTQSYMRGDGRILPDWSVPPMFRWEVPGVPREFFLVLKIARVGESENGDVTIEVNHPTDKFLPTRTIHLVDMSPKRELGKWRLHQGAILGDGKEGRSRGQSDPKHLWQTVVYTIPIPKKASVRFRIEDTAEASPIFQID